MNQKKLLHGIRQNWQKAVTAFVATAMYTRTVLLPFSVLDENSDLHFDRNRLFIRYCRKISLQATFIYVWGAVASDYSQQNNTCQKDKYSDCRDNPR